MIFQLIVVGLCVLVAVIFMARKILRALGGKPQCECGSCGGGDECQSCAGRDLRNLNYDLRKK